jgi:hypothetical protein
LLYLLETQLRYVESKRVLQRTRYAVGCLSKSLGRPAMVRDLNVDAYAGLLDWMHQRQNTPATIHHVSKFVRRLWRFAGNHGLTSTEPPDGRAWRGGAA